MTTERKTLQVEEYNRAWDGRPRRDEKKNGGFKKLTKLSFYENVIADLLLFI